MEKTFIKGNEAIAEAAVRAGCRFFAGYPITPQNEIPEYMSHRLPEVGGAFIQGESETASIYMVYGAACSGTRCMTSSSGPGISLKTEGISYLAGASLPAVIVDVARAGAGLGHIFPGQSDYAFFKAPGHGGFKVMVLAPSTVQEAVDLTYKAFDLADRDKNPVVVLTDGVTGTMMESVVLPEMKTDFPDKADWAIKGCQGRERRVNTSVELDTDKLENFQRACAGLYESWEKDILCDEYLVDDAEIIITAYGISARVVRSSIKTLRSEGIKVGMIRPITLVPFPYSSFEKLDFQKVKAVLDIEMAIPCQMEIDIKVGVSNQVPVLTFGRAGGKILSNEDVIRFVHQKVEELGL